jgi:hypothetical protein
MIVTMPVVLFALTFGSDWLDQSLTERHNRHQPR